MTGASTSRERSQIGRRRVRETTGDPWEIAVAAYARALAAGDRRELHARVNRAASLLEQTGDAYHLADLFHMAGYRAL